MGYIKETELLSLLHEQHPVAAVLENIENEENVQVPETRRARKIKHRSQRPQAIGGIYVTNATSGKKKRRVDNCNYLLSLADPDEALELSIQDFIPQTASVFSKMFINREKIEILNDFLNCSQNNEEWFKGSVSENESSEIQKDAGASNYDLRSNHPAYIKSCFQRISYDLRFMLKKRVPLGALIRLEEELITFFVNRPTAIYHCQIADNFERLLIHALSQYMDLLSLSYDRNGSRWTRVKNKHKDFILPDILLSSYLENRYNNRVH